jgi:hypothetical protein
VQIKGLLSLSGSQITNLRDISGDDIISGEVKRFKKKDIVK